MTRSRLYELSRPLAGALALAVLAACSGGGGTVAPPSISQVPAAAASSSASSAANTTSSGSRFLTSSGTGSDSSNIVYTTNPPHVLLKAATSPAQLPTPSQCEADFGFACYTPALMRAGYNVPSGLTGAGQTIVIVDAFGSPTIQQDLKVFDLEFGLPDPTLNILYPSGQPTLHLNDVNQQKWAFETSLDVEWAHAIAPGATIDLVIAATNYGNDLNVAENYAVQNHLGSVMSMSFGSPEAAIKGNGNNLQLLQADKVYQAAQAAGMTVFASAGDNGASNGYPVANASFPASDPLVTGVGGTDLFLSDSGAYQSETVWNDSIPSLCPFGCLNGIFGATGGAPSVVFAAPSYQKAVSGMNARTVADVAYNASVYTGVLTFVSFFSNPAQNGFYFTGGTSAGSPQWAAIIALANQSAGHALGFINPKLYAIAASASKHNSSWHDVTVGSNAFNGPGFSAAKGYDLPTGLGTPNVANLIGALTQ